MDQLPRPPDLIDFDGCGDARADAQDVTDAQDMYVAALAAAKKEEPVRDTPEAIRSYYELAKYYGKDSFLEMLLGNLVDPLLFRLERTQEIVDSEWWGRG